MVINAIDWETVNYSTKHPNTDPGGSPTNTRRGSPVATSPLGKINTFNIYQFTVNIEPIMGLQTKWYIWLP